VSEKSDIDAEKARLLRRDAEWVLAASEGRDIERILSFWTDDAVVLPPGLPAIIGKAALRQYVESSLQVPGFRITWSTDEAVLSPDGKFAYLLGNNAVTMDHPTGAPVTTKGRAVTIWQRGTDGEWRCAVDIWNAEPTADRTRWLPHNTFTKSARAKIAAALIWSAFLDFPDIFLTNLEQWTNSAESKPLKNSSYASQQS
jgi:ketosteroid isomerase-like protein